MKIYTTVEPVPSRMIALVRLLLCSGPLSKDKILKYLQPPSAGRDKEAKEPLQAKETLDAALECGLITDRNGVLTLAEKLKLSTLTEEQINHAIPQIFACQLLQSHIGSSENQFAIVCAWFLCQPILSMPQNHGDLKERFEQNGFDLDILGLRADLRWDMVIYWIRYLGLGRQLASEKARALIPDPTLFLVRHLDDILPESDSITANSFRKNLGRCCPVLDGGVVFDRVRSKVAPETQRSQVSESLSFALDRLQKRKVIRYWCPDDQRTFLLTSTSDKIAFIKRC